MSKLILLSVILSHIYVHLTLSGREKDKRGENDGQLSQIVLRLV